MSESITIARPYAKAIFEHALAKKQLLEWSRELMVLALVMSLPIAKRFFTNPEVSDAARLQVLDDLLTVNQAPIADGAHSFLALIIANKRLFVLPAIEEQFIALRALYERTMQVKVKVFSPLTETQKEALIARLNERLKRQVTLDITLDSTLLGGFVIEAGDLVINNSVRGQLDLFAKHLVV